jgi:MoaA/NifB/PqqE/SkfB family radical SAM enzyme
MCDIWRNKNNNELRIVQWIETLNKLSQWLGSFRLTVTGGEPFMKVGIWDFLDYAVSLGLPVVVITNGTCFNRHSIERLLKTRLTQLVFSVDGADAAQHDLIRGVDGAYRRTWLALEAIAAARRPFLLGTSTVIVDSNVAQLGQLARDFRAAGVERIFFQPVQGGFTQSDGSQFPYDTALWPSSAKRINRGLDDLLEVKRQGVPVANSTEEIEHFRQYFLQGSSWIRPFPCSVKYTTFHCDAYGEVRMCIPYPGNIGNVATTDPAAIWAGARARQEREVITACTKPCLLNCNRTYSVPEALRYGIDLLHRRGS